MTFDEIGVEEVYDHESLEDVAEMRPSGFDWDYTPDMRSNDDRNFIGLADWQSDFPVDSAPRLTLEELLSIFI